MFWAGFKADGQGDGSLPTFNKPMVSADKEVIRLKELIHKHTGKYYEMETISSDLAGSLLKLWK